MGLVADLISPKSSKAQPPVIVAPPVRATATDEGVDTTRRKAIASRGRGSTILTSELGVTGNPAKRRSLGGK